MRWRWILLLVVVASAIVVAWWIVHLKRIELQIHEAHWVWNVGKEVDRFEVANGRLPTVTELTTSLGGGTRGPRGEPVQYETIRTALGAHWVVVGVGADGRADCSLSEYLVRCGEGPLTNVLGHLDRDIVIVDGRLCQWPSK